MTPRKFDFIPPGERPWRGARPADPVPTPHWRLWLSALIRQLPNIALAIGIVIGIGILLWQAKVFAP